MIMNLNLHRNLYDLSNFYKYDNFFIQINPIKNSLYATRDNAHFFKLHYP